MSHGVEVHPVTRFEIDRAHGWYVGADSEVVLAPGEPDVWPGMFATYCRLRDRGPQDLTFHSPEEETEFLGDVRAEPDLGLRT
jgi:hypothetical protein